MGMSMHDRYYEPEDDDKEDIDDYISDYVKFEMRKGGDLDPRNTANFMEAASELGFSEDLIDWDNATVEEQEKVEQYWEDIAKSRAEESYFDQ
jgi:hypothetical protein